MVRMWLMDTSSCADPRLPGHFFPPKNINLGELKNSTGVLHWKVLLDDTNKTKERLHAIRGERGYDLDKEDTVLIGKDHTPDYTTKIKSMYELQQEEREDTARMVEEGTCYFDVETKEGNWIRIFMERGDFLVIPPQHKFRFSPDTKNYVKLRRFRGAARNGPGSVGVVSSVIPTEVSASKTERLENVARG